MPLLPRGTLAALKGHPDGIVVVVTVAASLGAMAAGVPVRGSISGLVIRLLLYHIRCSRAEAHERDMARLKVEQAAVEAKIAEARLDLLLHEQQTLPSSRADGTAK